MLNKQRSNCVTDRAPMITPPCLQLTGLLFPTSPAGADRLRARKFSLHRKFHLP